MENSELYAEEQREREIKLLEAVDTLNKSILALDEKYVAPHDTITVANPAEPTDLQPIVRGLKDLAEQFKTAIEASIREPKSNITVDNIEQAKADSVEVTNLEVLSKSFKSLEKTIKENNKDVVVNQKTVKLPTTAKDYMSVRLTDGTKFYRALNGLATAVQAIPLVTSTETGKLVIAVANADGTMITGGTATVASTYGTGKYGTATYA